MEVRPSLGAHSAASSIPSRLILLDASVLAQRGEFERILIHELFHFVWVRLSNEKRKDWEMVLAREARLRIRGELGWSAEWRKAKLQAAGVQGRSPAWRKYACESFCDTAAWVYAGLRQHDEFTLRATARRLRKTWFIAQIHASPVSL